MHILKLWRKVTPKNTISFPLLISGMYFASYICGLIIPSLEQQYFSIPTKVDDQKHGHRLEIGQYAKEHFDGQPRAS